MQLLRGLAVGGQAISPALRPLCAQLRRPEEIHELWTDSHILQTSGPESSLRCRGLGAYYLLISTSAC